MGFLCAPAKSFSLPFPRFPTSQWNADPLPAVGEQETGLQLRRCGEGPPQEDSGVVTPVLWGYQGAGEMLCCRLDYGGRIWSQYVSIANKLPPDQLPTNYLTSQPPIHLTNHCHINRRSVSVACRPPPPMQYLPCFVAVGTLVQFYAVPRGNPVPRPEPASALLDTEKVRDRYVPV
jgi:hypothetical protein